VPKRRSNAPAIALLLLLAAAIATVSFLLGRQSAREPVVDVEVPVVRGEDLSTATNVLQELGLRTVLAPPVYDDQIPRNAVISSNPPAGTTMPSDGVVTVTYSNGPEPLVVPPLAGQPEESARDALGQVGLTAGLRVEEPSDQVPSGAVVRTEPAAGTEVSPAATVTLVVSSGPPPVVLPRVIGLAQNEAEAQLGRDGLRVEVERQAHSSVPQGRVIDQTPAPGTVAQPGSAVVLVVSTGPS
jgi:serine/threonine-protein kinase